MRIGFTFNAILVLDSISENIKRIIVLHNDRLLIGLDASAINLEVLDHGRGFDVPMSPANFASLGNFGLLGIRERTDLIGARLEADSASGKGIRLTVRL